MRIQLLSDLHLETETYRPEPAPGAELLVLAGDIDSSWASFDDCSTGSWFKANFELLLSARRAGE